MNSPSGYSVRDLGRMIACEPRTSAYANALRDAITPGCRVIDLGAGTGFFALLACRYGAGRVVAIEPHDAIELLPEMAAANGLHDHVSVFRGLSTEYDGTSQADVIISDLRGCLPLFGSHIPAIVDARKRLLAPGGRLIPLRDELRIAVASNEVAFKEIKAPWLKNNYGLDLQAGFPFAANHWKKTQLAKESLLSTPSSLGFLDYSEIEDPHFHADAQATVVEEGVAHGYAIWFDTTLSDGIGFSNEPGEAPLVYGQAFFPFPKAVALRPGDSVDVRFRADLIDRSYVYSWSTTLYDRDTGGVTERFRQSTFRAKIMTPADADRRSGRHVPAALPAHSPMMTCLSLLDGRRSASQVADALCRDFPGHFESRDDALVYVLQTIERLNA